MALCFNFLLHNIYHYFWCRTVFMGGRAISWIRKFYIYIYQMKEEKEMKEEQYAIYKKKNTDKKPLI